jgi:hypothetical protein
MAPSRSSKTGWFRRLLRGTAETMAMGGTARMGSGHIGRTGHTIQTRFIADSALQTVRDEDEASERTRALWSIGGALSLALLAGLTLVFAIPRADALMAALGLAGLVAAAAVALSVFRGSTRGSMVHLLGIFLGAASLYASIFLFRGIIDEGFGLAAIVLSIGAILGLVVGRR